MYKKSLFLVAGVVAFVLVVSAGMSWQAATTLPSAHDPRITLDTVFQRKDSKPLLIEFYSDTCKGCQELTPILHEVYKTSTLKDKLTWVMVDTDDPKNAMFTQIFGVTLIPDVYVFAPNRMKKGRVDLENVSARQELETRVLKALARVEKSRLRRAPLVKQDVKPSTEESHAL